VNSLYQQAKKCFLTTDPNLKIDESIEGEALWNSGKLTWDADEPVELLNEPGRMDKPEVVMPKDLGRRKLGSEKGRAALIHSLAHIELTAVNLAWDAVYRYRGMPKEYYNDWVQCAKEEATHFRMLRSRLQEMGFDYGSFPVHNELWKMAVSTAGDLKDRLAVVQRVFEARALDVVPGTIKRFESIGDRAMVKALTIICNEEVGHVSSGTRWFHYRCKQLQLDPDSHFQELLKKYMRAPPRGPFNEVIRLQAGFSQNELDFLNENSENKNWKSTDNG